MQMQAAPQSRARLSRTIRSHLTFRVRLSRSRAVATASAARTRRPAADGRPRRTPTFTTTRPSICGSSPTTRAATTSSATRVTSATPASPTATTARTPCSDDYGGGWCFMMGPHSHWWRPGRRTSRRSAPGTTGRAPTTRSSGPTGRITRFTTAPTTPSYAGGRYYHGGFRAAPPIPRVPATAWRGTTPGMASGSSNFRGSPPAGVGPSSQGGWRGAAPASGASSRGSLPFHDPEHVARFHLPLALQRLRRWLARRRRPPPLIARAAPVSGARAWAAGAVEGRAIHARSASSARSTATQVLTCWPRRSGRSSSLPTPNRWHSSWLRPRAERR